MKKLPQQDLKMALSKRLRNVLRWRGVKQKQFAAEAGIPYQTFRKYLDGRSPPGPDHLVRLMRARIDIGWLITGRNSGPLCDWLPDVASDFAGYGDLRFLGAILREVEDLLAAGHERRQAAGEATASFGQYRAAGRESFRRCLVAAETFSEHLHERAAKGATPEALAYLVMLAVDEGRPIQAPKREPAPEPEQELGAVAPTPPETSEGVVSLTAGGRSTDSY